nr:34KD protein [Fijivirus sp.]
MESIGAYVITKTNRVSQQKNETQSTQSKSRYDTDVVIRGREKIYDFLGHLFLEKRVLYRLYDTSMTQEWLLEYANRVPTVTVLTVNDEISTEQAIIAKMIADPECELTYSFSLSDGFTITFEKVNENKKLTITKEIYDLTESSTAGQPTVMEQTHLIFKAIINSYIEYAITHPTQDDDKVFLSEVRSVIRAYLKFTLESESTPTLAFLMFLKMQCTPTSLRMLQSIKGDIDPVVTERITAGEGIIEVRRRRDNVKLFLVLSFDGTKCILFDTHTRRGRLSTISRPITFTPISFNPLV